MIEIKGLAPGSLEQWSLLGREALHRLHVPCTRTCGLPASEQQGQRCPRAWVCTHLCALCLCTSVPARGLEERWRSTGGKRPLQPWSLPRPCPYILGPVTGLGSWENRRGASGDECTPNLFPTVSRAAPAGGDNCSELNPRLFSSIHPFPKTLLSPVPFGPVHWSGCLASDEFCDLW